MNHLSKGTCKERSLCERERHKPRWPKTRAGSGDEIRFAFTPGKYTVYAVHTKIGKCIFKGGDLFLKSVFKNVRYGDRVHRLRGDRNGQ